MSDFAARLRTLRSNESQLHLDQSKRDSLRMNALKSISPLVLKIARLVEFNEENFLSAVSDALRDVIAIQNELEVAIFNTYGELKDNDSYVYRRSWSLASTIYKHGATTNSLRYNKFHLALLTETDESNALLYTAGMNDRTVSRYRDLVCLLDSTFNVEDQSYSSTVDSTINLVSNRIEKLVKDIDFGVCKEDARKLAMNGVLVFTDKFINCFKDTPNERQEKMRIKSCLNHASKMFITVLRDLSSPKSGNFTIETFNSFEEELLKKSNLISESLTYLVELITDVLLERENKHLENIGKTIGLPKKTSLPLDLLINALHWPYEKTGAFYSEGQVESIAIKNHIKTLNSVIELVDYFKNIVNNESIKLSTYQNKQFDKMAYECISNSIVKLVKSGVCYDLKMLRASLNMVVYLNSDHPTFNKTLTSYGLDESLITLYRAEIEKSLITLNVNEFNLQKVKTSILCNLASLMIATNRFTWGVNTGYLAGHLSTSLIRETLSLFNYKKNILNPHSKSSLFESCLCQVTDIYINRWLIEASKTINYSQVLYSQSQISLSDTQKIITRLSLSVSEDLYQLTKCYTEVRKTFDHLVEMPFTNNSYDSIKVGNVMNTAEPLSPIQSSEAGSYDHEAKA
ncbi:hypothetical protein NMS01_003700 [Vibrio cholerae]|nr:hypothetical protein [Vibrio cholerae]